MKQTLLSRGSKVCFLLALVVVAIQVAGCRDAIPAPQETEKDTVAIYHAVIRRLYTSDDTFGGKLAKPTLYILRATNDAAGDPSIQQSDSVLLAENVQQEIVATLADLPTKVIWVDRSDQIGIDAKTGRLQDNGVILTLGNIKYENRDKALVSASIYVANLAAGGKTYIVEKKNGVWTVTGTTGVQWIS